MLSVNRMNAQIKLTEVWKAINIKNTPLNIALPTVNQNSRNSRSVSNWRLQIGHGKSLLSQATFLNDSKIVWNAAPQIISEKRNQKICGNVAIVK